MTTIIKTPLDIADAIFRAALSEQLEVIEKNEKRAERFQEPLPIPAWNIKQMIKNIKDLTARTFTPQFRNLAKQYPYNSCSDPEGWAAIAINRLRDDYLIQIAHDDADLFRQLCEIWPETTPDPTLTEQQRAKLANLQKQADDIMERAARLTDELADEFLKLADLEKGILRGTQSKLDTRIAKQANYLVANADLCHKLKERDGKW